MQLITGTEEFHFHKKSAISIGKFDGLHRGHKEILKDVVAMKEQGLVSAVFTFDPPPSEVFGRGVQKELSTREEKRRLLAAMGIDVLVEFPLNLRTAAMEPEEFVRRILVKQMKAQQIVAGTDLSFGRGGRGDRRLLEALQESCGYEVKIVDKVSEQGRVVSSTYIREAVENGDMELAAKLLGEPYGVLGNVVHGRKFGRTIGMPTVNLMPEQKKQLPPNGVYYSRVKWKRQSLYGITNIGCKPTVQAGPQIGVETYLYDFEGDIYGQELHVALLHFKRAEQKFDSVEQLKAQLQMDIAQGREYHGL